MTTRLKLTAIKAESCRFGETPNLKRRDGSVTNW